jgi:hypothetical protein
MGSGISRVKESRWFGKIYLIEINWIVLFGLRFVKYFQILLIFWNLIAKIETVELLFSELFSDKCILFCLQFKRVAHLPYCINFHLTSNFKLNEVI